MDFKRVILITVALISLNFALFSETIAQSSGKKQDVDLVFIGNSITLGVSLENRDVEAPTVKACEFLRQKSAVGEVRFYNNGKKGTFYLHPNNKGAEILGGLWGKAIYRQMLNH